MLHIVHLSDLHLDEEVLIRAPAKSRKRQTLENLGRALAQTRQQFDPNGTGWLVAVTGDMFDTATLPGETVKEVLRELLAVLRAALPQPTVLLLPGNHDVRAGGTGKCGWLRKSRVLPALRAQLAADPRLEGSVSLHAGWGASLVCPIPDDDLPVHLVAYDSTYLPYGLWSAGGMVRREELLSLFPELSKTTKPLVVMLHHHLIPTPVADFSVVRSGLRWLLKRLAANADYEEVMQTALGAGSALSTLQSLGRPVLVLHGHKHYPCVRLLSGVRSAGTAGPNEDSPSDILIVSAGAAGMTESYRTGRMSPLPIWPSFNHVQIGDGTVEAHVVAYPYRDADWDAGKLSRRRLARMHCRGGAWHVDPATPTREELPAEAPDGAWVPQLEHNRATVTIEEGTAPFVGLRKSLRIERLVVPKAGRFRESYEEGIDYAADARIEAPTAGSGAGQASSPREIRIPAGEVTTYRVPNGLYVSSADFAADYDRREAPYESVELVNRYQAASAELSLQGLLSQYGLREDACFGSVTDLTLGIERPVGLEWSAAHVARIRVQDCPPRYRLRIYWPLESTRRCPWLRRAWLWSRRWVLGGRGRPATRDAAAPRAPA